MTAGFAESSFTRNAFQEASSIRHYGSRYYLCYSGEHGHDISYAVSSYPDHGFTYGGTIISNGDVGLEGRTEEDAVAYLGNNHGGLLRIGDQYYVFYHRHTHGMQYSRQGCIEPVRIMADGTIPQVEITSRGASGCPLKAADAEYSAHLACFLRSAEGVLHYSSHVHWNDAHPYIAEESSGGAVTLRNQFIYNLKDHAVCGFRYLQFDGSEKVLALELRGNFSGSVELVLDDPAAEAWAAIPVKPAERWQATSCDINPIVGTHAVYFRFLGQGSCDMNSFMFRSR
jgi:hypothetical protein